MTISGKKATLWSTRDEGPRLRPGVHGEPGEVRLPRGAEEPDPPVLRAPRARAFGDPLRRRTLRPLGPVSYTHLTLPTNREV